MTLAESLEHLADLLETTARQKRLRKMLLVAAFAGVTAKGSPHTPTAINQGDELYVQGINDPMSGLLTKDAKQQPFGRALAALAAGKKGDLAVALYEKRWQTDQNPCPICDENALAGWIPIDEPFPSGDDEPLAHPNCYCELDVRRTEEE